ncbi:hypothetical protein [Herbaspirillum huttiense]|uniref:Uncharacterized protein n=2 Tax=Herbaspirillum huttiense TaxID=863372 RepID=A0AAJ2HEZ1_9BURK|nr:hypothetical protein [Herbaspirillum huttiense]MDR9839436.1 hypothetical protein [Herbaspirillum huttiense]
MQKANDEVQASKRGELQALIIEELQKEGGLAFAELAARVADRSNLPLQQVKSAIQYMGQVGRLSRVVNGKSFRYWMPGDLPTDAVRDPDRQVVRRKFSLPPNMNHEVLSPLQWSLRHLLGQTN